MCVPQINYFLLMSNNSPLSVFTMVTGTDRLLPRTHAQGVKQSVCPSVVVVVVIVIGTKIARSRVLGVCVCCKHNQSVDIGEKLVCTRF